MVDKIEMSLDEIIKSTRQKRGRGAGAASRRGGGTAGPGRRNIRRNIGTQRSPTGGGSGGVLKGRNRGGAVQKAKFSRGDVNSAWKHDMYDGPKRASLKAAGELTKILVSNLDYGVSDADIQELFTEFGPLRKASVHYDRSGRSLGTADVLFERRSDALKAIKQYNGVPLDGRPMNIQLATSDVAALTSNRLGAPGTPLRRRPMGASQTKRGDGRRLAINRTRGGGNARRGKTTAPSAEELDAELDAYVKDMKI